MKDELTIETALTELLTTTVEAKDFILAELPEVIQQLLMWKMVEAITVCLFCILFLGVYLKFIHHAFKKDLFTDHRYDILTILGALVGGLISMFNIIGAITSLLIILQIWVAPKVYLIEYVRGML